MPEASQCGIIIKGLQAGLKDSKTKTKASI